MQLSSRAAILVDARGLAPLEARWGDLRANTFTALLEPLVRGARTLTPGEEVAIECEVPGGLPRNADVKTIVATLTVTRAAASSGEPTSVEVVTGAGAQPSTQTFGVKVTPSGLPSNVQVRLDQGDPIWSHGGVLPEGPHEIPNFAPQANAYLDKVKLPPSAPTTLRFMVKSDTPGAAEIAVAPRPAYSLLQTQTWPNPLDGSLRIDRQLDLDFGAVTQIDLDPLLGPNGSMARGGVSLDVSGTLGPERMLGSLAAHDDAQFATISGDYFVAQRILLGEPTAGLGFSPGTKVTVAGLTGVIEVDAEAELYAEIQPDAGGGTGPATGTPLAKLNLTQAPPDAGLPPRWAYAAFETPAELAVDGDYWIVLKGIRGTARLGLASVTGGYLGRLRVNRGGRLWRPLDPSPTQPGDASHLAAVLRLVYLPDPDIQSAALEIRVPEAATPQLASPGPSTQRIAVAAGGGNGPTSLVFSSHARGAVTVANVVQEFEFASTDPGARRR